MNLNMSLELRRHALKWKHWLQVGHRYLHSQSQEALVTPRSNRGQSSADSLDDDCRFKLSTKRASLLSVWNEWFGVDEVKDDYGGVNGRNKLHGSKWRKHVNATAYSKLSQLIKGIQQYAAKHHMQPEDVVAEWNPMYVEAKLSVSNLVKAMQASGKFKKLTPCGAIARK